MGIVRQVSMQFATHFFVGSIAFCYLLESFFHYSYYMRAPTRLIAFPMLLQVAVRKMVANIRQEYNLTFMTTLKSLPVLVMESIQGYGLHLSSHRQAAGEWSVKYLGKTLTLLARVNGAEIRSHNLLLLKASRI